MICSYIFIVYNVYLYWSGRDRDLDRNFRDFFLQGSQVVEGKYWEGLGFVLGDFGKVEVDIWFLVLVYIIGFLVCLFKFFVCEFRIFFS